MHPRLPGSPRSGLPGPFPGRPRALSRRQLLAGVGALGIGSSLLAGCGGGGEGRSGAVTVWDLFSGADGANMRGMVADVEAAIDGLNVDVTTLAWGNPYYTKLAMASSSQAPPDTAIMHASRMPGFAPGGLLQPWDPERLARVGIEQSHFTDALWESCTYEGELFALPLDTHPFIAMFDPDIAERAGVLDADGSIPIDSPEAMTEVGAKLAEVTGAQGISFGHLLDTAQAWRLFWGLYHQTGSDYTIEVGSPAELDIDGAASVIRAVNSWMDGTVMPADQDYGGALASFNGGRTGMILTGEWELLGFQDAKGPELVDGMPMPTMFGTPANYADSHAYVLPAQRGADEQHLDLVYEFVAGILDQGGQWGTAGHIPAYLPAQDTPTYQELDVQQHYAAAAEVAVFDPPVWFAGGGTDFQNRMCQVLIEGFRGAIEPERAAERLVQVLEDQLTSPDPTA
ncbi:MAG: ABC transporter substrate-binding protein [Dermabacteraceae bacterium]